MVLDTQVTVKRILEMLAGRLSSVVYRPFMYSIIASLCLTTLIVSESANGQVVAPMPPQLLCDEAASNCDGTVTSSASAKKWNPGHYLKTQGNPSKADQADYFRSVENTLRKIDDSPLLRGALIHYSWGMLEPSLGNYDLRPIRDHLEFLSARGKKLILVVDYKCFGSDCSNLAPAELSREVVVTSREYPTQIVEVWEERNMDHFIALWNTIGATFDDHPALEVVFSSESTPSLQGEQPANYSPGDYGRQLERLYAAQGRAFTSTNVVANVNFLSGKVSDLVESAYQSGGGRAMPDVFDSDGSLIFRADCIDRECGVRDYRREVPHVGIVSHGTLVGEHGAATDSPKEVLEFGATNKLTHYAWVSAEEGEDSWSNIIAAIENDNGSVYAVCPRAYKQGCK